jgi:hypothetical protein
MSGTLSLSRKLVTIRTSKAPRGCFPQRRSKRFGPVSKKSDISNIGGSMPIHGGSSDAARKNATLARRVLAFVLDCGRDYIGYERRRGLPQFFMRADFASITDA